MDHTQTRRARSAGLTVYVGRHLGTALYLLSAEIRFKAFCTALYLHKRPYIGRQVEGTLLCSIWMLCLAAIAEMMMEGIL